MSVNLCDEDHEIFGLFPLKLLWSYIQSCSLIVQNFIYYILTSFLFNLFSMRWFVGVFKLELESSFRQPMMFYCFYLCMFNSSELPILYGEQQLLLKNRSTSNQNGRWLLLIINATISILEFSKLCHPTSRYTVKH